MKSFYHWRMDRTRDAFKLLSVLLLVLGCHLTKSKFMDSPAFDVEGHRGSRGLMPENTIPAMYKAIDLGVTTLEMDVVITKDKKVVLSHEPFFSHEITTKPDGREVQQEEESSLNIYQMNYDQVKLFDVGTKKHPRFLRQEKIRASKPLLADLIDSVEWYCKQKELRVPEYNIETKSMPLTDGTFHPSPQEFVELVMGVAHSKGIQERMIIQSFDFRTLQYVHQHHPLIRTAMLVEDFDKRSLEQQLKDLGFTPTIYSPAYSLVNGPLIEKCHQLKMKVIPWTVNDKPTIEQLKEIGVDGIITDYPDLFKD
jgi:glycerophosphoryl diester phosphodiesterase